MRKKRKWNWGRIVVCGVVLCGSIGVMTTMTREHLVFKQTMSTVQMNQEDLLILVNQEHKLPDDYQVELSSFEGYEVASSIRSSLEAMYQAAKRNGVLLQINNTYRSIPVQQEVFDQKLAYYQQLGMRYEQAYEKTKMQVQEPGYSEHHTGYAIDFSKENDRVANEKMWTWLNQYAFHYGFVLRYPEDKEEITQIENEAWHYRYVGKVVAQTMVHENLCLEEYIQRYGKD